jgi:hypothetical protein
MIRELSGAYRLPAEEVLTALGADLHRGLTDQEAVFVCRARPSAATQSLR